MKRVLSLMLVFVSVLTLAACSSETKVETNGLQDGTYEVTSNGSEFIVVIENGEIISSNLVGKYVDGIHTVTGQGKFGDVVLDVTVVNGIIENIHTNSNNETESLYLNAVALYEKVIERNGHDGLDAVTGATFSSNGILEAINAIPRTDGTAPEYVQVASSDNSEDTFDLEWSVQPELGLLKGNYFYEEEKFRQGHIGSLTVVTNDENELILVEFNETGRENYYTRFYQDVPKRMSEYNFTMGAKKGAAWIQSAELMEKLMVANNKLTFEINPNYDSSLAKQYDQPNRLQYLDLDIVAGASNSIQQSMIPLAGRIDQVRDTASGLFFYQYAEKLTGEFVGLTALLRFVVDAEGNIVDSYYDEIFADSKDEIVDGSLKKFYRQSKYQSVTFEEPARIGFNVSFDALEEHLLAGGSMFDIIDLPATGDSGSYSQTGFTKRNTAWDNYLRLAEILHDEMVTDGRITAHELPEVN
ncbi:FMN-binding protein [Mycoplasmatota bacterium WC44]